MKHLQLHELLYWLAQKPLHTARSALNSVSVTICDVDWKDDFELRWMWLCPIMKYCASICVEVLEITTGENHLKPSCYCINYQLLTFKKFDVFPAEWFLHAFAKLRKATINYAISVSLSVRPSFRVEQLSFHWRTDFLEIWYLSIFQKYVEKIQVCLKSGKNVGYFTWRPMYIYDNISLNSS
jgi:hypothetical protein